MKKNDGKKLLRYAAGSQNIGRWMIMAWAWCRPDDMHKPPKGLRFAIDWLEWHTHTIADIHTAADERKTRCKKDNRIHDWMNAKWKKKSDLSFNKINLKKRSTTLAWRVKKSSLFWGFHDTLLIYTFAVNLLRKYHILCLSFPAANPMALWYLYIFVGWLLNFK